MNKLYYTWNEYDKDIHTLAFRLKRYHFKSIIALARGGLTIGTHLSHLLKAHLTILSISSYENKQRGKVIQFNTSYIKPLMGKILLVDDVSDSGESLSLVKEHLAITGLEVRTATLFYKPHSIIKPNTYIHEVSNDQWIIFAWEY